MAAAPEADGVKAEVDLPGIRIRAHFRGTR